MNEPRKRYVPVVGPRLKRLLTVVFALFALLVVNSVYLAAISMAGVQFQNYFYLWMFLLHLGLGLLIVLPVVLFGAFHIRNARNRPNKRAIKAGYALFTTALLVLLTGFMLLTRADGLLATKAPVIRQAAYWLHVIGPLLAIWLFILHRLAGRRIKWKVGLGWSAVAAGFAGVMLILQTQDPRAWGAVGPEAGRQYYFPSLAITSTGNFIPAQVLDANGYCVECHPDVHDTWSNSVHKFSSFNNPPYEFSIKDTRRALMVRDGNVQGSRFCAGCHDPVPFFSGAFEDPRFDDPLYDLSQDAMAQAGITCTVCHSISQVGTEDGATVIGNADYTITEPIHYPFAFSDSAMLRWVNRQLVKAKPEFHKATFLKPLHQTTQFCGTCHKVHLPKELNAYRFLPGQNHYDAFWLSGVSGYGVTSFYYPPKAQANCNGCHMPLIASNDIAARDFDDTGQLKVHDHMFPSANTAMATLVSMKDPGETIRKHQEFLQDGVMRVDIFAIKEGGGISGELHAPLGEGQGPVLKPGETYLIEIVLRTIGMGHLFTQGTADSNQVWLDVTARSGDTVIGRSGGMRSPDNEVDPWSHFVNAFVLDRDGNRINRRNAQDIFVALYNNQIPPGAADVVHCLLEVPENIAAPIEIDATLQFRKFDTEYMRLVYDDEDYVNNLPITAMASDRYVFEVEGVEGDVTNDAETFDLWKRWNDYGIALLRKGRAGELRQAERAFTEVETLGRPEGPLNLARVYLKEGRVSSEAPEALRRARDFSPAAYEWSVLWFTGLVNKQNGNLDEAVNNLKQIVAGGFRQAVDRNFDFSKDYRLLNQLGQTLFERAKQERGSERRTEREELLLEAITYFNDALVLDPENAPAHYSLKQIYADLGDDAASERHGELHLKYKPDDNARDRAIAAARRRYPAANHAAEAVVIYDLQRSGAYDLPLQLTGTVDHD